MKLRSSMMSRVQIRNVPIQPAQAQAEGQPVIQPVRNGGVRDQLSVLRQEMLSLQNGFEQQVAALDAGYQEKMAQLKEELAEARESGIGVVREEQQSKIEQLKAELAEARESGIGAVREEYQGKIEQLKEELAEARESGIGAVREEYQGKIEQLKAELVEARESGIGAVREEYQGKIEQLKEELAEAHESGIAGLQASQTNLAKLTLQNVVQAGIDRADMSVAISSLHNHMSHEDEEHNKLLFQKEILESGVEFASQLGLAEEKDQLQELSNTIQPEGENADLLGEGGDVFLGE